MSQPKVLAPIVTVTASAASLPVTGNIVAPLILLGLGLIITGLLLVRASRVQRDSL